METVNHDQHLLMNADIAKKIADNASLTGKRVLEIGCGKGILTKELAKNAAIVIGIEVDMKFAEDLASIPNLEMHWGNALQLFDAIDFDILIANIPYAISEPLFYKLLHSSFENAILMISSGFYQHLTSDEYKVGVLAKQLLHVRKLFDVTRENFEPIPDTDSIVVEIAKKKEESLIGEVLLQFDKKVENAIREAMTRILKISKKEAREKIDCLLLAFPDKKIRQLKKEEILKLIWDLKQLS